MKLAPGPEDGGPSSMFHDEGASTDVTGSFVSSRALITAGKGSRTSPEKENPVESLRIKIIVKHRRREDQISRPRRGRNLLWRNESHR
jgi:hypothetical protein